MTIICSILLNRLPTEATMCSRVKLHLKQSSICLEQSIRYWYSSQLLTVLSARIVKHFEKEYSATNLNHWPVIFYLESKKRKRIMHLHSYSVTVMNNKKTIVVIHCNQGLVENTREVLK
jgi:hypothetical protein